MSDETVHVAMFPAAGMGHLMPFLRLASLLLHHHCQVTVIACIPTISLSESQLLSRFRSAFPQVNILHFHLQPTSTPSSDGDPIFLRVQALRSSSHLFTPLLSSLSPPLSAFISDILLLAPLLPITHTLHLPNYSLFTSSAAMFCFLSIFVTLAPSVVPQLDALDIPGIPFSPLPTSSIPPLLTMPDSIFRNVFMEDIPNATKLHGFFVNTFEALESQSLEALNAGKVVSGMPPVHAVGPFVPCEFEKEDQRGTPLKWLDDQADGSVVYVCFGSRTALGRDQIREIGDGLMRSGCRFLWVVKDKILDREDQEVGLDEVLGVDLMERVKEKGLVLKEWVDQSEILGHRAVGGFVSHCGWNSLMEAAWNGVPILAWPQHGDQKVNAGLVKSSGWGIWNNNWGWAGERLVKGEEIGEAIKEMMKNQALKIKADELKEAGRKATSIGGDCEVTLHKLIHEWKKNVNSV